MIRHTSSLAFSLVIHTIIISGALFLYSLTPKDEVTEKKVIAVKLSQIVEKIAPQPKPVSKPLPPKIKPKPKPKKEIAKVVKKPKVEPKPEPIEEIVEEEVVNEVVHIEQNTTIVPTQTQTQPIVAVTTAQPSSEEIYFDEHLAEVVALLQENLYYPRSARKRGIQGEVKVKFVLNTDASVEDIEVIDSSHKILSKAAKKTIQKLDGDFPKPEEKLILHLPINYSLK